MPGHARRCAALLLALVALFSLPAVASAQRGPGGYDDYELSGCTSERILVKRGRCDARRPVPDVSAAPSAPRTGAQTVLNADTGGRGVAYAWDLDDDGAFDDATGPEVATTFATTGNHRVRVKATDEDGRVGEAATTIATHASNLKPDGSMLVTPASPRVGQEVVVQASGRDPDGALTKTELDLDGDGTYEVSTTDEEYVTRKVTFATAGKRTLRLRLTDEGGATFMTTTTVDVHATNIAPAANVSATPASPRPGQEVRLNTYGTDPDGAIVRYEFDFDGDGTYDVDGNAPYATTTFTTAGQRTVAVRVTDDAGAQSVSKRSVDVTDSSAPPVVSIFRTSNPRMLFAQATDPDGTIAQYAWDLDGDGVFQDAVGPNASTITFPAGVYGDLRAAVRVTDNDGKATTRDMTLRVLDQPPVPPSLYLTPTQPRAGQTVQISAGLLPADIVSYEWDTDGDGVYDPPVTQTLAMASFTAGPHTIRVRVTDARGRTAVARQVITVSGATGNLAPTAAIYGSASGRVGAAMSFSSFGGDQDGTITATAWDLDEDGQFDDSTAGFASTSFATTGQHFVAVRVTDNQSATGVGVQEIEIHTQNQPPDVTISAGGSVGASLLTVAGTPAQLYASSYGTNDDAIVAWAWDTDDDGDFDDGTETSKLVTFSTPGVTRVRLRATDAGGLVATSTLRVEVSAPTANRPPVLQLLSVPTITQPGVQVNLYAIASDPEGDPLTYAWDTDGDGAFDDGNGSFLDYAFPEVGAVDVRVRVTDGKGGERIGLQTAHVRPDAGLPPTFNNLYIPGRSASGSRRRCTRVRRASRAASRR